MPVGVDVKCMHTKFSGRCLFGFGDIATCTSIPQLYSTFTMYNYVHVLCSFLLFVASPVRCIEDTYQHKRLLETESDNMLPVFDSLNYLSLYPWRINNRVGREGGREGEREGVSEGRREGEREGGRERGSE